MPLFQVFSFCEMSAARELLSVMHLFRCASQHQGHIFAMRLLHQLICMNADCIRELPLLPYSIGCKCRTCSVARICIVAASLPTPRIGSNFCMARFTRLGLLFRQPQFARLSYYPHEREDGPERLGSKAEMHASNYHHTTRLKALHKDAKTALVFLNFPPPYSCAHPSRAHPKAP